MIVFLFIYLIVAIRIMLFKVRMIFRLYRANQQGYVNVRSKDQLIQVTLDKPIPILPFIWQMILITLFWPLDFLKMPGPMLRAYLLLDKYAMANLFRYYAQTYPLR